MRLQSELFNTRYAMSINAITISDGFMVIHSADTPDQGLMLKYKVEDDGNKYDFTLSKKDFTTLYKLGSFDLEVKADVIHISNNTMKMKLGNMAQALKEPDIEEMKPLNVSGADILAGKNFVSEKDRGRIQLHGVSVFETGLIATDNQIVYTKYFDTGVSEGINIPKSCFSHIDPEAKVYTDGRLAVFVKDNVMMYTSLIANKLGDMMKDNMKQPIVQLELDVQKFRNIANILKDYKAEKIELEYQDGVLHIRQHSDGNEFDFTLPVQITQGEKLHVTVSQKSLDAILSKMVDEPLGFCEINMVIHNLEKNEYTLATYVQGHMEVA
ncbi:MAG: hypothetical protein Q4C03_06855 [bacterium]|nr:hypothetical protein [bacterium]